MADLPTNYLDDILAQSMNGKRKYRITRADGTFEEVTLEDVSEYEQVGSNFGAGDINKTNQAVNEKFDSGDVVDPMLTTEPGFAADAYQTKLQFDAQNKNLGGLRFGVDGDGNYGYYGADDSLIPFSSLPNELRIKLSVNAYSDSLSGAQVDFYNFGYEECYLWSDYGYFVATLSVDGKSVTMDLSTFGGSTNESEHITLKSDSNIIVNLRSKGQSDGVVDLVLVK